MSGYGRRWVTSRMGMDGLDRSEREQATSARPRGALALVRAWEDIGDSEIDAMVADINAAREQDAGREVAFEGCCTS